MIHATAVLADDCALPPDAEIGPLAVIDIDRSDLGPSTFGAKPVCRSHAVVYRGSTFGGGLHVSHGALIREECRFGENVSVGSHTIVEHHVTLGDGVRLHSRCFVPEFSELEEGAWLGPGVTVTNSKFPNRPDSKAKLDGVRIEQGATIGAASVLLPGITIGSGALIGAGSVVTKDVPAGAVIIGNPGRTQ